MGLSRRNSLEEARTLEAPPPPIENHYGDDYALALALSRRNSLEEARTPAASLSDHALALLLQQRGSVLDRRDAALAPQDLAIELDHRLAIELHHQQERAAATQARSQVLQMFERKVNPIVRGAQAHPRNTQSTANTDETLRPTLPPSATGLCASKAGAVI